MKINFALILLFFSINFFLSQNIENLDKLNGFKEIKIGENISKYKSNIVKIDKNNKLHYGGMPETDNDVYYYESETTKTIFGYEIANIFLVTDYYQKISQISVIPKKSDNEKQIVIFYNSEFGKSYSSFTQDEERNSFYLWQGNEVALRIVYYSANGNIYPVIDYLISFRKLKKDK